MANVQHLTGPIRSQHGICSNPLNGQQASPCLAHACFPATLASERSREDGVEVCSLAMCLVHKGGEGVGSEMRLAARGRIEGLDIDPSSTA